MRRGCWIVFAVFLVPNFSFAAITFSEIAWMGSVESANHEWIELHNEGSAIDVSGWTITDDMNLSISLEGVVPANSRVVLERTSDTSAPGAAFLIYTGSLVNAGATLKLIRADGSVEDQIAGGEGWELIGGDNTTKETAQYTEAGWVTAYPTPGSVPAAVAVVSENPEQKKTSKTQVLSKTQEGQAVYLKLPDVTLDLDLDTPEIAYVNQELSMSAVATGAGDTIINSLEYDWNFGDGSIRRGREVSHVYKYPGTYVVTTFAEFKRQHATLQKTITVLPVSLSLTQNSAGDVQVNNDSPYELDLSGYKLVGENSFVFPPRTFLLANQTITVPTYMLGKTFNRMLALYDTEKVLLATILPGRVSEEQTVLPKITAVESAPVASSITYKSVEEPRTANADQFITNTYVDLPLVSEEVHSEVVAAPDKESLFSDVIKNDRVPYILLLATVILAVFGIYLAPRNSK